MNTPSYTADDLRLAARLKETIDRAQKELDQLLRRIGAASSTQNARREKAIRGNGHGLLVGLAPRRKHRMSAAGRARIAAAAKARWAKLRAGKRGTPAAPKKAKRSKFSPAMRARLGALAKDRWAKARASGRSTLAAV